MPKKDLNIKIIVLNKQCMRREENSDSDVHVSSKTHPTEFVWKNYSDLKIRK
jgi:hypothetical protein